MPTTRKGESTNAFQQSVNLRLNSSQDDTLLFAALPGSEGAHVSLDFFSIWVSVPQGQCAAVQLQAPHDQGTDPSIGKLLWIPLFSQGAFGSTDVYVGATHIEFDYDVPNGGSTAPVPSINVSVRLSAKATETSEVQATAYFCGAYLASAKVKRPARKR